MYIVKKIEGLWRVVCKSSGIIQFSSMHKGWCRAWIVDNDPQAEDNSDSESIEKQPT